MPKPLDTKHVTNKRLARDTCYPAGIFDASGKKRAPDGYTKINGHRCPFWESKPKRSPPIQAEFDTYLQEYDLQSSYQTEQTDRGWRGTLTVSLQQPSVSLQQPGHTATDQCRTVVVCSPQKKMAENQAMREYLEQVRSDQQSN